MKRSDVADRFIQNFKCFHRFWVNFLPLREFKNVARRSTTTEWIDKSEE
jgi:hypothetical protein